MIDIKVKVNGGLFSKNVPQVVRDAMYEESLQKIGDRMVRGGKGLGAKRNTITPAKTGELELTVSSTRIYPRTRGTAWVAKNIAIAKAMAPRVLRKAADRVVDELSGGL